MKQNKILSNVFIFLTIFALMALFSVSSVQAANPAAVNLLTAGNFVVISKAQITDVPSSVITGNVGASPITGASIHVSCTEVSGTIYGVDAAYTGGFDSNVSCYAGSADNKTYVDNAILDMGTAYNNASGRVNGTGSPDYLNEGAGILEGLTLYPGIHKWTTAVTIGVTTPGDVILDCQGDASAVFIFQIPGTLDIASGGSVPSGNKVNLTNGCQASNIFWAVSGATTLGTYSTFNGNILTTGTSKIALQTGAVLTGRALSDGEVTLQSNKISLSGANTLPTTPTILNNSNTYVNHNVSINWSSTDADDDTITYDVYFNGGHFTTLQNNFTTNMSADGLYYLNVSAFDGTGYSSNNSIWNITLDTLNPNLITNDATNNSAFNHNVTFSALANDTNILNISLNLSNSTDTIQSTYNDTGATNLSALMDLNLTQLSEGNYTYTIKVTDRALNTINLFYNIIVDRSNPVVISSSTSDITTSGATLTVNANDTYSGINNCTYSGAGSGILSFGSGLYTASLGGLSASTDYIITVNCTDNADNSVTSTTSFKTSATPSSSSSSSSGGGGGSGGGSGGGGPVSNWPCAEWSTCSSGTQTRTCTQPGDSSVTSKETQSCTPTQTTVIIQNTTVPTAPQTTDLGNTGTTSQDNNAITPTGGNPITDQAVSQTGYLPPWWVTALVLLGVLGLIIGGYFYFNNPKVKLPKSPRPITQPN